MATRPNILCREGSLIIVSILLALLASGPVEAGAEAEPPETTLTGDELVERIRRARAGEPDVRLTDATIEGRVDLGTLRTIDRPLRCTRCTFTDDVVATDVEFTGVVEIVDSTFNGVLDARGAVFRRSVALDRSQLHDLDLTSARFEALASFGSVDVTGRAIFERVTFEDRAEFSASRSAVPDASRLDCAAVQGAFVGQVSFDGSTFSGPSRFRNRCHVGPASFRDVRFSDDADFAFAEFYDTTSFERASAVGPWSFQGALFVSDVDASSATIDAALDLTSAEMYGEVIMRDLSGSGRLVLSGVTLGDTIDLHNFAASGLVAEVDLVERVRGDALVDDVLGHIESTARDDGQTGPANEALYDLRDREFDTLPLSLLYGNIAGFLLRPTRPLSWLAIAVCIGAIVRFASRAGRRRLSSIWAGLDLFFSAALDSLGAVFRRSPIAEHHANASPDDPAIAKLRALDAAEWVVFKVLLACIIIGIANSNATLKEMLDSIA